MPEAERYPHTLEAVRRSGNESEHMLDPKRSARIWRRARTLQALGKATDDWLTGKIGTSPTRTGYRHPNEETMGLLPYLSPLLRAGILVTRFTQPGCLPDNRPLGGILDEQRAVVNGYMKSEDVGLLEELVTEDGEVKLVATHPRSINIRGSIVVSRHVGEDVTVAGFVRSRQRVAHEHTGLHPDMIDELVASTQVTMYDPEWGRNSRMWPLMQRFFEVSQQ